jgi:hypothetical protein
MGNAKAASTANARAIRIAFMSASPVATMAGRTLQRAATGEAAKTMARPAPAVAFTLRHAWPPRCVADQGLVEGPSIAIHQGDAECPHAVAVPSKAPIAARRRMEHLLAGNARPQPGDSRLPERPYFAGLTAIAAASV